jgi:3-deoxy-D-manno-octulosonic acid kinase
MLQNRTIDSFCFGFSSDLTESQLIPLVGLFQHSVGTANAVLGGRTAVTTARLEGIGAVVIKHYRRGGLLRHMNRRYYLNLGKSRAQHEFELLETVAGFGIHVPQPVAFALRGRLIYQAWLITRKIQKPQSLAELSTQDEKAAGRAMESVVDQIALLIQHRILHVDLHPGNVIMDAAGKVYLLDFDRGKVYHGDRQKLKNRYLTRWQRAVNKHGLPEFLAEMLRAGLKST